MKDIKKLMQYKGYTQSEFADKLNVTEATVSRWVNGRNTPHMHHLREIAKLLGVEIKDLLEEVE